MKFVVGFMLTAFSLLLLHRWYRGWRSVEQLKAIRAALLRGAVLVDVRTAHEYEQQHLPGAINIPLHQLTSHEPTLRARNAPVVLYCATGIRSRSGASLLRKLGLDPVFDLGRMTNFRRLKMPEKARRTSGSFKKPSGLRLQASGSPDQRTSLRSREWS